MKYHKTSLEIKKEAEVIEKAKKDSSAFKPIYESYFPQLSAFIYKRLDDKEVVFDIVQKTFVKALEKLHKYEFRGLPFSSWLYRIAINELNQYFRSQNRLRTVNLESSEVNRLFSDVDDSIYDEDQIQMLKTSLKYLSSSDYLMIEMRYFEERPFKEIAQILEITETNAKVKTYRAMDKLKKVVLKLQAAA